VPHLRPEVCEFLTHLASPRCPHLVCGASPTEASEAIITTGVIGAKQKRDVMTLDIPNAFVQTDIRGQLVDILLELCPGVYDDYVIDEGKHKILYVRMLKA
jgi:hypothetical protein